MKLIRQNSAIASRFLIISFITAAFASVPNREPFQYRETTGKNVFLSTSALDTVKGWVHVHNEDRISVDDYLIDTASRECARWIFKPKDHSVFIAAMRTDRTIHLSGTRHGKEYEHDYKLDAIPWCQEWMTFLSGLAKSGQASAVFCSVVPVTFDLVRFKAQVVGEESVRANGVMMLAYHVRVQFSGAFSVAWHGDYWFRGRDGRFVRFEGKSFPGMPESVFELVKEGR
jgi:hypothetical protein